MSKSSRLIVIGGFAGSGKSTLARSLSQALSYPVFEIDHLARSIQDSKDFHGQSHEAYGISFDLFFSFAKNQLDNGCSMILDQNMGHSLTWRNIHQLKSSLKQSNVLIFLLDCPYELCLSRFAARTEHPNLDDVTVDDMPDHKHKWDYLNDNELPEAIRIDATQSANAVLNDVMMYLQD